MFICFLLIGKAFMEPRHDSGVFVVQKTERHHAMMPLGTFLSSILP